MLWSFIIQVMPSGFNLILVPFHVFYFLAEGVDVAASYPMFTAGTIAGLGLVLLKSMMLSCLLFSNCRFMHFLAHLVLLLGDWKLTWCFIVLISYLKLQAKFMIQFIIAVDSASPDFWWYHLIVMWLLNTMQSQGASCTTKPYAFFWVKRWVLVVSAFNFPSLFKYELSTRCW